jgi:hypothetical protein
MLSYLRIPLVDFALNHPKMFRERGNRFIFKRLNYHTEWLGMEPRKKFNGFEVIVKEKKTTDALLAHKFGPLVQTYRLYIPDLLRQLTAE